MNVLGSFVQRAATVGGYRVAAVLVVTGSLPVITRLYDPDTYAVWVIWTSIALLFSRVATLAYDNAIVLPEDDDEVTELVFVSILTAMVMAILTCLIVALAAMIWPGIFMGISSALWIVGIPVFVFAAGLFSALGHWCVRREAFAWYAGGQLVFVSVTASAQMLLGWLRGPSADYLIYASIGGQVVAAMLLLLRFNGGIFALPRSMSGVWGAAKKYRNYPLAIAPRNLVAIARDRLVYIVLGSLQNQVAVSLYAVAYRLTNLPASLLASTLRPVYFQQAAKTGLASVAPMVQFLIEILLFLIVPFWVIFLLEAREIFALALGEQWGDAGIYAAILSCAAIPNILGNWIDRTFDVAARQRTAMYLELWFATVAIGALMIGAAVFDNVIWIVIIHTAVMTVYYWYFLFKIYQIAEFGNSQFWKIVVRLCWLTLMWAGAAWLCVNTLPYFAGLITYATLAAIVCTTYVYFRAREATTGAAFGAHK